MGLVEEVIPAQNGKPGRLITIEGNLSNPEGGTSCVRRMERELDCVIGYGTYEAGKIYPETYSVRYNGWQVIDENSPYFVDRPTREALRFLGLVNSPYYAYWFPEDVEEAEASEPAEDPLTEEEPKAAPEPEAPPREDGPEEEPLPKEDPPPTWKPLPPGKGRLVPA